MTPKNLEAIFKLRADNCSPLHSQEERDAFKHAAQDNNIQALEDMLQKWPTAPVDWRGNTGKPILLETYQNLKPSTLQYLIDNGANINQPDDDKNWPPVIHCSFLCNADTLEKLIRHGADVNMRDKHDQTALHYALQEKRYDCVDLLVLCGADLDAKNRANETPRDLLEKNPMAARVVFAALQRLKQFNEEQGATAPPAKVSAMKPIVLKEKPKKFKP